MKKKLQLRALAVSSFKPAHQQKQVGGTGPAAQSGIELTDRCSLFEDGLPCGPISGGSGAGDTHGD